MYPPPPPPPPNQDPIMMERNGQHNVKRLSNSVVVFLNVVNTLTNLFLGAVAFSAFSFGQAFSYQSAFTQHIYLVVSGYVILMSQAILSMNPHVGWAQNLMYSHKKIIHASMQIIGSILAIIGCIIMIVEKQRFNLTIFSTAHGICGMIAMLLTVLSFIGGCLNFVFAEKPNANLFQNVHRCFGSLTISVAFIALCIAFSDTYSMSFGDVNAGLSILYTILALIGILISMGSRFFK